MPIRPTLINCHKGPLTMVKYNREGDLLFSCAKKDKKPCAFYANTGERLGTYNGHEGAVYDLDVNFDSSRLLTAGSDRTTKLWDVQTGRELFDFPHQAGCRSVGFAEGDKMFLTVQDDIGDREPSKLFIYNVPEEGATGPFTPMRTMFSEDKCGKMYKALWGPLNNFVISCCEDGSLRKWNVETGQESIKVQNHKKSHSLDSVL